MDYIQQPVTLVKNGEEITRKQGVDYSILNQQKTLENSFYIFPESPEENKVQKARAVLGELAQEIPDEELAVYITQFQYLLDSWLDEFEKQIFNNLTLKQLLREGR